MVRPAYNSEPCAAGAAFAQALDQIEACVDDNPLIFKISFMYYTLLGTLILIVVAFIVSFFTGGCEPFDERLLAPFVRSKNWKPTENGGPANEAVYKEIHPLQEFVKRNSVTGAALARRISIDVA